ncbi:MAG: DUF6439 family protein [Microcystaceae cyanobacterium]
MTQTTLTSASASLDALSDLELAQILAQRLGITPKDWHRLKGNRKAQAGQSLGTALVYLLNDKPEEALTHLNQAKGWLDRSITPLPCPSHGNH